MSWYPMDRWAPGDGDVDPEDISTEDYGPHDLLVAQARVESERIRDYVRSFYGVPADFGRRVAYTYNGRREGEVVGFIDSHLLVRLDGESQPRKFHPTWEIEYLPAPHGFLEAAAHEFIPAADGIECLNCLRQEAGRPSLSR